MRLNEHGQGETAVRGEGLAVPFTQPDRGGAIGLLDVEAEVRASALRPRRSPAPAFPSSERSARNDMSAAGSSASSTEPRARARISVQTRPLRHQELPRAETSLSETPPGTLHRARAHGPTSVTARICCVLRDVAGAEPDLACRPVTTAAAARRREPRGKGPLGPVAPDDADRPRACRQPAGARRTPPVAGPGDAEVAEPGRRLGLVQHLPDRVLDPVAVVHDVDDRELLPVGRPVGVEHVLEHLARRSPRRAAPAPAFPGKRPR